jgi:group I intron endonuclease
MLDLTEEQFSKYMTSKSRHGVIYKISNKINDDFYIGSTQNFVKRYYTHINHMRINKQSCTKLIRAVNKYGEQNFKMEILEECDPQYLLTREQFYLDNFLPTYNIAKIAGSTLGIKRSEEVKLKKSLIQKNNWEDPEYKKHHLEQLSKNWRSGVEHMMAKLNEEQVVSIKKQLALGYKPKEVSDLLNLSYHSIKDIHRGKTWKNIVV